MISYKEKLNTIDTFIFDIDGVFTDGGIFFSEKEYTRKFNAKDAYAVQLAAKSGYNIFIVTGAHSEKIRSLMLNLGCKDVVLGAKNKLDAFNELSKKYQMNLAASLYMGDDMPDISLLKKVHVATCPQDAAVDVKAVCDYQSPYNGGAGCVRDVIEQTMRVQNKWDKDGNHEW